MQQPHDWWNAAAPAQANRIAELCRGLAANPALPPAVVDQLIALDDHDIRWQLASRDDLGDGQIHRLAATGDTLAVGRLLRDGRLPPGTVTDFDPAVALVLADLGPIHPDWARRLATDPDPATRAAFATADHVPADALDTLADDPDLDVVTETARWARLTAAQAERLAAHPHLTVRSCVAVNEYTPPHVLVALAGRRQPAARHCAACAGTPAWQFHDWSCDGTHADALLALDGSLAGNPSTPPYLLREHAAHPLLQVRWALAGRQDLPRATYLALAQDPVAGVRGDLAENPAIGEDLMRAMAEDDTHDVRRRLAHNPAVPLDVLIRLAEVVKVGAAMLPRIAAATPAELRELAASAAGGARMLAAAHPGLPHDLVDRFATDRDARVVKAVAPNPALTELQLRAMLTEHGPRVAAAVARNPACPPSVLTDIARRTPAVSKALRNIAVHDGAPADALLACLTDERARWLAAGHPALRAETVIALLADDDLGVAARAAANPALPGRVMSELAAAAARIRRG
ncbi:hypothetical protein Cs7R123_02030 [Catellatospora sp. TT07R-123]|uniref:hypothetical protein n=1 Tax=Catellatospora sp. TT07R-123 TaxID=2733863 RepID=UPI001B039D94|nr:hypothetical protein [Catellatospora sp. TT07R-123]GHJ42861.1 hypothetical protein Cs7R123_02030 [Catellatospora sp. TT07R-123]